MQRRGRLVSLVSGQRKGIFNADTETVANVRTLLDTNHGPPNWNGSVRASEIPQTGPKTRELWGSPNFHHSGLRHPKPHLEHADFHNPTLLVFSWRQTPPQ